MTENLNVKEQVQGEKEVKKSIVPKKERGYETSNCRKTHR